MGAYGQLVPIFLILALAPFIGIIALASLVVRRPHAGRPAFLFGFTRAWIVASLIATALGVVAIVAGWLIFLRQ